MALLFCPHCDEVVEVRGEPRGMQCDDCGAELERCEDGIEGDPVSTLLARVRLNPSAAREG
jgi:hypothetical protein